MNTDLMVIGVYLLAVLGVMVWLGKKETLDDFLVNSRKTPSWLLIFSVVSSTLGAGAIVGVASEAYNTGISFGVSIMIVVIVGFLLLAWLAPKIKSFSDAHNSYTIGGFFEKRFSTRVKYAVSLLTIAAFIIFLGGQFVALASLINVLLGFSFFVALLSAAVLAIAYTALAGLRGDIYTDFLQFLVITIAFFLALLPFGILETGFPTNLPDAHLDLFNFGGPTFFFGSIFLGGFFTVASMDWWQRIFASKGPKESRKIFLWSALISVPFYLLPIGLGLVAFGRFGVGINPDQSLFYLMRDLLPSGMLGLGYAGLISAIMSTVDTNIMASSSSFFNDFWKPLVNKNAGLKAVRVFVVIFGLVGLLLAYVSPKIVDLVLFAAYLLGMIAIPVLTGLFWKKTSEASVFWALTVSTIVLLVSLPVMGIETAWVPALLVNALIIVFGTLLCKKNR